MLITEITTEEQTIIDLEGQIDDLNQTINDIELTPGPQGPTGSQGPQGEPAPTELLYGNLILSIVALVVAAYVGVRRGR